MHGCGSLAYGCRRTLSEYASRLSVVHSGPCVQAERKHEGCVQAPDACSTAVMGFAAAMAARVDNVTKVSFDMVGSE